MANIMTKEELKALAQEIIAKGSDMTAEDWFNYESDKMLFKQAAAEVKANDGKTHGLSKMGVKLVAPATQFSDAKLSSTATALAWARARKDLKAYKPKAAKPVNKIAAELAAQLNEGLETGDEVITLHECKMMLIRAKEAAQAVIRERDKAARAACEAEQALAELQPKFVEACQLTEYDETVHGALISQLDSEAYALLGTKNCMSDEFYEEVKRYLIYEFMLIHSISMMDGVNLGANAEKISEVPIIALPSEVIRARFSVMSAAQKAAKTAVKEEALRQSESTADLYAAVGKAKAQALVEFYSNPDNKGVNANVLEESVAFENLNKTIIDKASDEVKAEIEALNAVAMEERSMHRDTFHKKMYLLPPCPYGDDAAGYWEEIWRIITPVRYINALSYENSRQQIAAKHSGINNGRKKSLVDMYPEEAEAERQEWLKGDRESHLSLEGVRTNDKDADAITAVVNAVAEALKTRWVFYNAAVDDTGDLEAFMLNHGLTTFATIVDFNKTLLDAGAQARAKLNQGKKLNKADYGVHSVYGTPFSRASLVKALWELMSSETITTAQFAQLCDSKGDIDEYTKAVSNELAHEEYTLGLYRNGVQKLQWELGALSPYARKPWRYTFNNGAVVDVACMQELISCVKVDLEVPSAAKVMTKVNAYAPVQSRAALAYFIEHIQNVEGDFTALMTLNRRMGINTQELSERVIQKLIQVLGKSADVQRGLMYMVDNYLYESPEKHKINLRDKDGKSTDMLKAWTRIITTLCDKFIAARTKRQADIKQLLGENGYLLPEEATAKEKRMLDLTEVMAWLPWATEVAKAATMQSIALEGIVTSIPISEDEELEELLPDQEQAPEFDGSGDEDVTEFYCLDL